MNQDINFYRGGTHPPRLPLSAEFMAWSGVAVLLLLIAVSVSQRISNNGLRARADAAQRQADSLQASLAELEKQHPVRHPDPALLAEIERTQRSADGLNRVLSLVDEGGLLARGGFSAFFEALARQARTTVWLTGIRFRDGGRELEFAGNALTTDDIPKLVQSMGSEAVFKAKTFSDLVIKRPDRPQGQIDFILRTRIPDSKNNAQP